MLSNLSIRLRMRCVFALLALQLSFGGALGIASLTAADTRWNAQHQERVELAGAIEALAWRTGEPLPERAARVAALAAVQAEDARGSRQAL